MRELRKGSYREVPQEYYGSPKEVWGFRTDPDRRAARKIAEDFLRENHRLFKLEKNLDTLHFRKTIRSLGAQHVIFQQRWRKLWIHRAYVTVHLDNEGSVYMAKNRAMPKAMMPNPNRISFKVGPRAARRRALKEFRAAERRVSLLGREKLPRMETLLLPRKDKLYPAYRFRIYLKDPRQEWIVYVNGRTGRLVTKYDNLAHVNGRGSVFDPNPVVELGDYRLLLPADRRSPIEPRAEAYRIVTLRGLKKTGFLDGRYVTTDPTSWRVKHPNREFCFKSRQRGFAEVMAYYHIDTAARYLEALGFCGSRAILKGALAVDA